MNRRPIIPLFFTFAIVACFLLFFYWIFTVILPVATVELSYQSHKTMQMALGTTDIRGLLLPQFRIEADEKSKYPNGGITIPSLYLDEPIIYNIDPNNESDYLAALKKGIAQASSTRLPGNGGLGYYFAHSSTPNLARQYNAVFYLLGKLHGGERVSIWHDGQRYDYTVTKTIITDPADISFLHAQYDKETIVLQTCWPPGTSEKRLLVFAERS